MLTNVQVAKLIEACGHGKLPSGCHFYCVSEEEVVVIAPASPMPKVYYLRDKQGLLVAFKAM